MGGGNDHQGEGGECVGVRGVTGRLWTSGKWMIRGLPEAQQRNRPRRSRQRQRDGIVSTLTPQRRWGPSSRIDWKSTGCFGSFPQQGFSPPDSQQLPNTSMNFSSRMARRRGFTLVELLVVLAIIGILAGLLLTSISMGKSRARQIQCISNIRQLGQALQAFRTDFHAFPVFLDPSDRSETRNWESALNHQMGLPLGLTYYPQGVWDCPAAKRPTGPWWERHRDLGYEDYNYNAYGLSPIFRPDSFGLAERYSTGNVVNTTTPVRRVTEGEVVSPSEMLAIGEALFGGPGVIIDGSVFGRASAAVVSANRPSEYDYFASTRRANQRHQGRANVGFTDGHVEALTLKTLFEDTSDAALSLWNRDHQPHRERLQ